MNCIALRRENSNFLHFSRIFLESTWKCSFNNNFNRLAMCCNLFNLMLRIPDVVPISSINNYQWKVNFFWHRSILIDASYFHHFYYETRDQAFACWDRERWKIYKLFVLFSWLESSRVELASRQINFVSSSKTKHKVAEYTLASPGDSSVSESMSYLGDLRVYVSLCPQRTIRNSVKKHRGKHSVTLALWNERE